MSKPPNKKRPLDWVLPKFARVTSMGNPDGFIRHEFDEEEVPQVQGTDRPYPEARSNPFSNVRITENNEEDQK